MVRGLVFCPVSGFCTSDGRIENFLCRYISYGICQQNFPVGPGLIFCPVSGFFYFYKWFEPLFGIVIIASFTQKLWDYEWKMSLKFACLTLITCEERVSKKFKLFLGIFSVIESPSDELFRHANTSMEDESTLNSWFNGNCSLL